MAVINRLLFEPSNRSNWARQLIKFVLVPNSVGLWEAILPQLTDDNFPRLKILQIPNGGPSACMSTAEPVDLPILRQLTSFAFGDSRVPFDEIWPTLKVHINEQPSPSPPATSKKVKRRFWLYCPLSEPLLYEVCCTMTARFAAEIQALDVKLPPLPRNDAIRSSSSAPPILPSLVCKFHALIHLYLEVPNTGHYELIPVVRVLASLKALARLELILESYKQFPSADSASIPTEDVEAVKLHPPKLTAVSIRVRQVRHGSFHVPTIVSLFPSVRPVGVSFMACETCGGRIVFDGRPIDAAEASAQLVHITACWSRVLMDANEGDTFYNLYG